MDAKGQSLIEFVILIPLILGIVVTVLRVNSAIQVSIVNQKYARTQALTLAGNSPVYPPVRLREGEGGMIETKSDQMILGVSDNLAVGDSGYVPKATTQVITRNGRPVGNDSSQSEPKGDRGNVRIRNTLALCTQLNATPPNNGQFQYCRSPDI